MMVRSLKERQNSKILIVDDDQNIRHQLKFIINKFGYNVVGCAEDKASSIQQTEELKPNLIIMDVIMDTPDAGILAAKEIHEKHGTPIIFLTGTSGTEVIESALGTNPYGYLSKPVKPESLEATIELAIVRHEYELELKKMQNALVESEALFRGIFGAIGNGYYRTDLEGKIKLVNPALLNMIGFDSEADIIGKKFIDLSIIENYQIEAMTEALKSEQKIDQFEAVITTKDGNKIFSLIDAKIHRPESGESYIEGTIQDVSKLKNLENNLRHNQKMEVIAILGNRIAHEINNRLTSILGYSDLSMMKTKGDEKLQKYLTSIKQNANDATNVIRHLLHFSRKSESKNKTLETSEFISSLEPIIRTLIWKNIELTTSYKDKPLHINTNPDLLEQALMNLIINAREAMPDGGKLIISNELLTINEGDNSNYGLVPGRYSKISVKDTGKGVDPEISQKIFEPFFTTKAESLSTGLGLSSVKEYVENNSGEIFLISELDKGTEFIILLPLKN